MVEVSPIPISFKTGDEEMTFPQVHTIFKDKSYGQKLAQAVRYKPYKPESMTDEGWTELLGADVNNLEHMRLTYGLTRQFLRYCNDAPSGTRTAENTFSRVEQEDLLLTAIVHDWGEAVVGDTTYDQKTAADEDEEQTALQHIIGELLPDQPSIQARVHRVVTEILPNKESKLGKAFNAIERIGYLRTGLRAMDSIEEIEANGDNLRWLSNNVLLNQIPTLLEYSKTYPPVQAFLGMNSARVSQAFGCAGSNEVFDKYGEDVREQKRQSFQVAYDQWFSSSFVMSPTTSSIS